MPTKAIPQKLTSNQEKVEKLQNDPVWFIQKAYGADLWFKQVQICASVRDNPKTTVRSCHASGKSFTAGHVASWFLLSHKNSIVLTTAPTWRQVQDVMWKEIRSAYRRSKYELPGDMQQIRYNISDEWFAIGISTDEPDKFNGYHAKHLLIVIDESSGIPADIFEAIEGVGSTGNVRILELGNPTDPTGHFASTFTDRFYNKIWISCFHTPNFKPFCVRTETGDLDVPASIQKLLASTEIERAQAVTHPMLIVPQWVYERAIKWGIDSPMFQSRCLGDFPDEGDDTLIPLRYIQAAVDRTLPTDQPSPKEYLGVDVARYGMDKTVLVHRREDTIVKIETFNRTATTEVAGRIAMWHRQNPWGSIRIDDSGVGGGVTDICVENDIPVIPINVGEKVEDEDEDERFINKRGKFYWQLGQLFRKGQIDMTDEEDLVHQLNDIKYKIDSKGRIVVESKDDIKKRNGGTSPDYADALMLAFADDGYGSFSASAPKDEEAPQPRPLTASLQHKTF